MDRVKTKNNTHLEVMKVANRWRHKMILWEGIQLMKRFYMGKILSHLVVRTSIMTELKRVKKAILANFQETTSMRRYSSYSMWMVVVKLPRKILIQLQSRWAGTQDKVSGLLLPLQTFFRIVAELIFDLDPNHDGVITEEEFNVICKYISQRGNPTLPPIGGKSSTSRSGSTQKGAAAKATMHMYEMDKKRYGALLPKTGVYFLPDDKVLSFLR